MSAVAQPRLINTSEWGRFADGTPFPNIGWPIRFSNVFRERQAQVQRASNLLIIAVGEREADVAHVVVGQMDSEDIVRSLDAATNGIRRFNPDEEEPFQEAFEKGITRTGTDVLLITQETESHDVAMGHLGSREIGQLVPHLGELANRLSSTA